MKFVNIELIVSKQKTAHDNTEQSTWAENGAWRAKKSGKRSGAGETKSERSGERTESACFLLFRPHAGALERSGLFCRSALKPISVISAHRSTPAAPLRSFFRLPLRFPGSVETLHGGPQRGPLARTYLNYY